MPIIFIIILNSFFYYKVIMSNSNNILFAKAPFQPASWQLENIVLSKIPSSRLTLGRFPTPIHQFKIPALEEYGLDIWIKRDDLTSFDLSGNKVRKLEFILADVLEGDYDSVITIGGLQSNHARATAVAARQLGLNPHLILRTPKTVEEIDLTGNLLWNRLVDSTIHLVTPGTYGQIGSDNLVAQLHEKLLSEGKKPYSIPMGGSNTLGAFGYMETIKEIIDQGIIYDHIVFASGSGGTVAGMAIGAKLSGLTSKIHSIGVCDNPKYFYDHLREISIDLGLDFSKLGQPEDWVSMYDGQGLG